MGNKGKQGVTRGNKREQGVTRGNRRNRCSVGEHG